MPHRNLKSLAHTNTIFSCLLAFGMDIHAIGSIANSQTQCLNGFDWFYVIVCRFLWFMAAWIDIYSHESNKLCKPFQTYSICRTFANVFFFLQSIFIIISRILRNLIVALRFQEFLINFYLRAMNSIQLLFTHFNRMLCTPKNQSKCLLIC